MSSINSVNLIGRLTAGPRASTRASGHDAVRKMRIAVQRPRGKDGEDKGANYFDVVAFGRPGRQTAASTCARAARSPSPGSLNHSEWNAEDGSVAPARRDHRRQRDVPRRPASSDEAAEEQETAVAAGVGAEDDSRLLSSPIDGTPPKPGGVPLPVSASTSKIRHDRHLSHPAVLPRSRRQIASRCSPAIGDEQLPSLHISRSRSSGRSSTLRDQ